MIEKVYVRTIVLKALPQPRPTPQKRVKNYLLAIFYNFRIISKNRFLDAFAGSWGPGVV